MFQATSSSDLDADSDVNEAGFNEVESDAVSGNGDNPQSVSCFLCYLWDIST